LRYSSKSRSEVAASSASSAPRYAASSPRLRGSGGIDTLHELPAPRPGPVVGAPRIREAFLLHGARAARRAPGRFPKRSPAPDPPTRRHREEHAIPARSRSGKNRISGAALTQPTTQDTEDTGQYSSDFRATRGSESLAPRTPGGAFSISSSARLRSPRRRCTFHEEEARLEGARLDLRAAGEHAGTPRQGPFLMCIRARARWIRASRGLHASSSS